MGSRLAKKAIHLGFLSRREVNGSGGHRPAGDTTSALTKKLATIFAAVMAFLRLLLVSLLDLILYLQYPKMLVTPGTRKPPGPNASGLAFTISRAYKNRGAQSWSCVSEIMGAAIP
jgi:hypothetical protein